MLTKHHVNCGQLRIMTDLFYLFPPGEDLESLLFHFMDEWLFIFSAEPFFIARVGVLIFFGVGLNKVFILTLLLTTE